MPKRHIIAWLGVLCLLWASTFTVPAQSNDGVEMSVSAGYDTYFRESYWTPVRIEVQNSGVPIEGKLIIRPETSGRVVSNAYSTPVNLPTDSNQTVFLYIQARTFPPELFVELIDNDGVRVAEERAIITAVNPQDLIHVVVTGGSAQPVTLNDVHTGGFAARQALWTPANLPDRGAALEAVDTLWLSNVDTGTLTVSQQDALRDYVLDGGHLFVMGGPAWEDTTRGIVDLLPLIPDGTTGVDDLTALADRAGDYDTVLDERTLVTTGTLREGAVIVAETEDQLPLIVRQQYGAGLVDFVLADPSNEPLRSWDNIGDLWQLLTADINPRPAWSYGFHDPNAAATAIAVLPGIDLLPPASSMMLFLAAYILLIGPVNYLVLNRLNRRNWAWLTIPLFIGVFSVLAWTVGFNLRGNDVILSRLTVIRSHPGSETAAFDQLVGILSPRRETYELDAGETRMLRVMPEIQRGGFLSQNITQSTAEIVQGTGFSAQGVAVDGGIFANFNVMGTAQAPAIGGSLSLSYNPNQTQSMRGLVRNDSDSLTLYEPVLLARGVAYRLGDALAPGDIVTFDENDLTLAHEADYPAPSPVELHRQFSGFNSLTASNVANVRRSEDTITDILGLSEDQTRFSGDTVEGQEYLRRRAFLRSFMRDQHGDTGRGHQAYLVGWSSDPYASSIQPGDTPFTAVDTTLFITELDVHVERPGANEAVTIQPDQFTWVSLERDQQDIGGPNNLMLISETGITLQFMPIDGAVLEEVNEMRLFIDRGASYGRDVILSIWNWQTQEWEPVDSNRQEDYVFTAPARYLGPDHTVRVQLYLDSSLGSARINELFITQTGTF